MTIYYEDIFESDADIIVVAVNQVGVMGAGQAKQFSTLYPHAMLRYYGACNMKNSSIKKYGYMFERTSDGRDVLLFATKDNWRNPSSTNQLRKTFKALEAHDSHRFEGVEVACPLLGCGLGGLKKDVVIPLITRGFMKMGAFVKIYDYPKNSPKMYKKED